MKNKKSKLLALILTMVLTLMVVLPACTSKNRQTIIILAGVLGSGLYDSSTGEPVWDPFMSELSLFDFMNHKGSINLDGDTLSDLLDEALPILSEIMLQSEESILKKLYVDEDGVPLDENIIPVDMDFKNPERLRYGILNYCTDVYNQLSERYGNKADVIVFNYDWRLDNRASAQALENFINDNGFKQVTLVTHSMGGNVASLYLAKSQDNRDKVKCLASYGTPYLGSVMTLDMLENLENVVLGALEAVNDIPLVSTFLDCLIPNCPKGYGFEQLTEAVLEAFMSIMNSASVYQLLPHPELLNTKHYLNTWERENYEKQTSFINLISTSGETKTNHYLTTKEQLIDFYTSRFWAMKSDNTIKQTVLALEEYWDSMYVEVDGKKVFSTDLVNTHYFVGTNYGTSIVANYNVDTDSNGKPIYSSAVYNAETTGTTFEGMSIKGAGTNLGDGIVLAYSATANHLLSASNVHIVDGADHFDVFVPFKEMVAYETYSFLDRIIFKEK